MALLPEDATACPAGTPWTRGTSALLMMASLGATLVLHLTPLAHPMLVYDDFQVLAHSYTWEATHQNLWRSHNEHVMPLGRLSTWLLVQLAGRPTALPVLAAWQGPLAVLAGMLLLYVFLLRELGHPLYGLIGMALFGITTQYREAVWWFSASFGVLALDTFLLALLAAQRWRQGGRIGSLLLCAVASALAPCWFASGILAGPLCCIYLTGDAVEKHEDAGLVRWLQTPRSWLIGLPLLGTVLFSATGLLRNVDHIMHLEHWGQKNAVEAFHPLTGLLYTGRSLADNLVLGNLGISGAAVLKFLDGWEPFAAIGLAIKHLWLALTALVLILLVWGAWRWWRRAPNRPLLVLGAATVLLSYGLIYSARAEWPYETVADWGRYQLLAHLGLVFFLMGGLPRWRGWGLIPEDGQPLDTQRAWRSGLVLAGVFEVLFMLQLPRGLGYYDLPQQTRDWQRIERVDARCRQHRIAAATARQALPPLTIAGCSQLSDGSPRINGWEFLHGSDDPLPHDPVDVWQLLQE